MYLQTPIHDFPLIVTIDKIMIVIFMPPQRSCRRHYIMYVSGLSARPDVRPDCFVYAITQVLLDGISSNLVRRSSWM